MNKSYLSRRVANLPPSGIRKYFDIAATMPDVISLGIGEPDFITPPPIAQAGQRSLEQGFTKYTSNAGILELREALADHLEELYGVKYAPEEEMFITVGVSEALLLAMTALLDPGDEVIVPTPCFMAYQADVLLSGGVPVEVASTVEEDFQLNPQKIAAAVSPKTKAILVGYPNNPTGAVATPAILQQVIRIAKEHDLVVLTDEIYDQLVYGRPHVCVAALEGARERTVLMGGFSKDYAMTGWRVGYACGPQDIIAGMLRVHQYAIMSAPTTAQIAAIEALENGAGHVAAMRTEYDRRRRLIVDGLNGMGLHTFEPGGAFFAFPQISSTGLDDETFAERLLKEEQVAVVPGSVFGPGGEGFVRCSYATAYEQIEEALVRIERFVRTL